MRRDHMYLILGDITEMDTDAIINPASTDLKPAEGICKAIFMKADTEKLKLACRRIGHCSIGQAVVTPAFGLRSKVLIHVAGPGWSSGHLNDREIFQDCYQNALYKAYSLGCRTVSLPLMFSGSMHIPRTEALKLVDEVVSRFEKNYSNMDIDLVVYRRSIFETARKVLKHRVVIEPEAEN